MYVVNWEENNTKIWYQKELVQEWSSQGFAETQTYV